MHPSFLPRSRRPSRINHRANLEAEFRRREKTPVMAPDGDIFCYNHAFVSEWAMAADLWERLPAHLTSELMNWQAAGAAVMTVLARYDNLEKEAPSRGWPEKSHRHLSRTTSHTSPTPHSPVSSVLGSPPNNGIAIPPPVTTEFALVDTPPFTPKDSFTGDDYLNAEKDAASGIIDDAELDRINSRLASMYRRSSSTKMDQPSPSATPSLRRGSDESITSTYSFFDEAAWDVYINSCKAELDNLRCETLVRFRHLSHGIDRVWADLNHYDKAQHISAKASAEFVAWWKLMNDKAQDLETEAKALELPDLEEVKSQRLSQGLSI